MVNFLLGALVVGAVIFLAFHESVQKGRKNMKTYIIMLKSNTNQDIVNYFRNRDVFVTWKDQEELTNCVVVETNHSVQELEEMMYVEIVKEVSSEKLAKASI